VTRLCIRDAFVTQEARAREAGNTRRVFRRRRLSLHAANALLRSLLTLCLAALVSVALALPGAAQVQDGATLTVIRGTAVVVRADGSVQQPAASGSSLTAGDRISTLGQSGALVTFFEGSEVEMGSDATIAIRELHGQGSRVNITLESIIGSTVHNVVALTDPGSSYRVEAGSTVGLVRGTVFAHRTEPHGDVTVALQNCGTRVLPTGCLEFPREGMLVQPGQVRTASARGGVDTESFASTASLFDVVAEPAGNSNRSRGTDNPGLETGSRTFPQQQSRQGRDDRDGAVPTSTTGTVVTAIPTQTRSLPPGQTAFSAFVPAGSKTLPVVSTEGFKVGDVIVINPGGTTQEQNYVASFGSIITGQNTIYDHFPGELVVNSGIQITATPTSSVTPNPTLTASPTSSPTLIPTLTASPTVTPSQTSTATLTQTSIPSPTPTTTATPTSTPTSTNTATPTNTLTPTNTATATSTPTATPTSTPTSTPNPYLERGAFVIGDLEVASGASVTFWGPGWSNENGLSGGTAPSGFKGFAESPSSTPPQCGGSWSDATGSSGDPPSTIPAQMAVVVSSEITTANGQLHGDIVQIVLVRVDPGYGTGVGQGGTGQIIEVICD
jgi:hypothetical protein